MRAILLGALVLALAAAFAPSETVASCTQVSNACAPCNTPPGSDDTPTAGCLEAGPACVGGNAVGAVGCVCVGATCVSRTSATAVPATGDAACGTAANNGC